MMEWYLVVDGWMNGRMFGQTTDGWIDRQMDGAPMMKVKAYCDSTKLLR